MVFRGKFNAINVLFAVIIFHPFEDQKNYQKSFLKSIYWVSKHSNNFHSNMTEVFLGLRSNSMPLNLKHDK